MEDYDLLLPYFVKRRLEHSDRNCFACKRRRKSVRPYQCRYFFPDKVDKENEEVRLCSSCVRMFKELRRPVSDCFNSTNHIFVDAARKWVAYNEELRFDEGLEVQFELALFHLFRDARLAFLLGQPAGTIMLISAAVELALNTDIRMQPFVKQSRYGWLTLNVPTLSHGLDVGCPILLLLNKDEVEGDRLREFSKGQNPQFIERRNKLAHGEVPPVFANALFSIADAEDEAYDQLVKGQQFLTEWGASEGNPVIHDENQRREGSSPFKIRRAAGGTALSVEFYNYLDRDRWH